MLPYNINNIEKHKKTKHEQTCNSCSDKYDKYACNGLDHVGSENF